MLSSNRLATQGSKATVREAGLAYGTGASRMKRLVIKQEGSRRRTMQKHRK